MHLRPSISRCAARGPVLAGMLLLAVSCATVPTPDQRFRELVAQHGDRAVLVPGVPDFPRRGGAEEGAAALTDLAVFWQKPLSYGEAAARMQKWRAAMPVEEALTASAGELGLWALSFYGSAEAIASKLRGGVPVAVMLQDGTHVDSRRMSVVVGYDDVAGVYLCHDGAATAVMYAHEEFMRKWLPVRYWTAVVCPPESARWPLSAQDLLSRGRYYEAHARLADARRDYEGALVRSPASDEVKRALALVLQKSGEYAKAEELYRDLYTRFPEDSRYANNLAYVLAKQMKGLDDAERIARQVVQREPTNPTSLDTLGYVLMLRENYTEAIPFLEKAYGSGQSLDPRAQREIAVHLALAYMGDRRDQLMKKIIREILEIDPTFTLPEELKKAMVK